MGQDGAGIIDADGPPGATGAALAAGAAADIDADVARLEPAERRRLCGTDAIIELIKVFQTAPVVPGTDEIVLPVPKIVGDVGELGRILRDVAAGEIEALLAERIFRIVARTGSGIAARTATAANRLSEDAVGLGTIGLDRASSVVNRYIAAVAASRAATANGHVQVELAIATLAGRVTAIAAAAADGLRKDARGQVADRQNAAIACQLALGKQEAVAEIARIVAVGGNIVVHHHVVAVASNAALAAQRQAQLDAVVAGLLEGALVGGAKATGTAAAADRLGKDTDGGRGAGRYQPGIPHVDLAAIAAAPAAAADRGGDVQLGLLDCHAAGGGIAAGAAAAADGLGEHAIRILALRLQQAGIDDIDRSAVPGSTALAADRDGHCDAGGVGYTVVVIFSRRRAAIAAAAADRLGKGRMGVGALGLHLADVVDVGFERVAAGTATAANGDRDGDLLADRPRQRATPRTAAAADALRKYAG